MVFNPDLAKHAKLVIFPCKIIKPDHLNRTFNRISVPRELLYTKHLGVYLDSRLYFSKHINEKVVKALKSLSLFKFLSKYVNRRVLDLSYKMYVRLHLDYGDVIYLNQRTDLMDLIERVQYKASLIVSGCWQETSRVKLYEELGWESLSDRRIVLRLTIFYKFKNNPAPSYLADHIHHYNELNVNLRKIRHKVPIIRTSRYENSFFPYAIKLWNELNDEASNKPSVQSLKTYLNDFKRPHF